MKIIALILGLFLFSSCNNLKLATGQKSISSLAIDYSISDKVNPIYKSVIDSTIDATIVRFNNENRSFTAIKRGPNDEKGLTIDFTKGRFVSDGGITAGYIVSGLGLIVTPISLYLASGGELIGFFYYFPDDKIVISSSLSPSLSAKPGKKSNSWVMSGALFSSKSKRLAKISMRLDDRVYKMLTKLDKQVKKSN